MCLGTTLASCVLLCSWKKAIIIVYIPKIVYLFWINFFTKNFNLIKYHLFELLYYNIIMQIGVI